MTTRMYAVVPLDTWDRLRQTVAAKTYGADGRGDEWLRVGGLKGFVDGSLGSHTAAFHEPFTDAPKDRGLFVNTPENLYTWIANADKAQLHVIVHAIGDRANGTLLDIFDRVARENGPRDRRFRIEHAQHLAAADIPRFKSLGVIASMQPYHAIDDGRWAEKVIGPERIKTTYAFRSYSTRAPRSPSAATGLSRRPRRSKAFTRRLHGGRWMVPVPLGGCRSRRSAWTRR